MSRPMFWLKEKAEEKVKTEEISAKKADVINLLSAYLEDYIPKGGGFSKSSITGPVGKMLSVVTSGRITDKEAILGYVVNIHNSTATRNISQRAMKNLSDALDNLLDLEKDVSKRMWLRILREIDYGVFKKKYEYIVRRVEEKKEEGSE